MQLRQPGREIAWKKLRKLMRHARAELLISMRHSDANSAGERIPQHNLTQMGLLFMSPEAAAFLLLQIRNKSRRALTVSLHCKWRSTPFLRAPKEFIDLGAAAVAATQGSEAGGGRASDCDFRRHSDPRRVLKTLARAPAGNTKSAHTPLPL